MKHELGTLVWDQAAELRVLARERPLVATLPGATMRPAASHPAMSVIAVLGARRGLGTDLISRQSVRSIQAAGLTAVYADVRSCLPRIKRSGTVTPTSPAFEHAALPRSLYDDAQASDVQASDVHSSMDAVIADLGDGETHSDQPWLNVIDPRRHEFSRRILRHAERVVLVMTPDAVVVLEAYARIKANQRWLQGKPVEIVVCQSPTTDIAERVVGRLTQCCAQFLQLDIRFLGSTNADIESDIRSRDQQKQENVQSDLRILSGRLTRRWQVERCSSDNRNESENY